MGRGRARVGGTLWAHELTKTPLFTDNNNLIGFAFKCKIKTLEGEGEEKDPLPLPQGKNIKNAI